MYRSCPRSVQRYSFQIDPRACFASPAFPLLSARNFFHATHAAVAFLAAQATAVYACKRYQQHSIGRQLNCNSSVVGSTNTTSGAFSSTFGFANTASTFSAVALGSLN